MTIFGNPEAHAERERQLAELSATVHQALQVAIALCNSRGDDKRLKLLFGRLEAVRLELEQMRRGHAAVPFEDIDPKWTGLLPWRLAPDF